VLGERDVQNRCISLLSIFGDVAGNPSVRKKRCPVTPCVPARRDGRYNLGWPSPLFFLNELLYGSSKLPLASVEGPYDVEHLATFFLRFSLFNKELVEQLPSVVAAAAYCLAVSMLRAAPWVSSYRTHLQ
jgi:hypothetical protein